MKFLSILSFCLVVTINSSAQSNAYSLADFYQYDSNLAFLTDSIFNSLNDKERIAQMIVTSAGELGKSNEVVKGLVENNHI